MSRPLASSCSSGRPDLPQESEVDTTGPLGSRTPSWVRSPDRERERARCGKGTAGRGRRPLAWLGVVLLCVLATTAAAQPSVVGEFQLVQQQLPFFPVHVTLLPTGKVMLWPGRGISATIWDPATGTTNPLDNPGYNIFCTGHSFLADGRLFVIGGHEKNVGLPNASIYDPVTNSWTPCQYEQRPVVSDGDDAGERRCARRRAATIGYWNNTLPQVCKPASANGAIYRRPCPAALSVHVLAPNGRVFNPDRAKRRDISILQGPVHGRCLANHTFGFRDYGSAVMYEPGKVLVVGGRGPNRATATAEVIDLNALSPTWRPSPRCPSGADIMRPCFPTARSSSPAGSECAGFNNRARRVHPPKCGIRRPRPGPLSPAPEYRALPLDGAFVAGRPRPLTGGNGHSNAEVYSPPYLFKGPRPAITTAPGAVGYGETFAVETPTRPTSPSVTWSGSSSVTHAFNQDQRLSYLSFSQAGGGLDVVSPANPNLAPPGYYLLFVVNGTGVPSVGKIVRLGSATPPASSLSISDATVTEGNSGTVNAGFTVSLSPASSQTVTGD